MEDSVSKVYRQFRIHFFLARNKAGLTAPPETWILFLRDISIEISVMTPIRPIKSVDEIEVGKHGLVIQKGWNRGLLLPQVPVEWGWDRDEFLVHICSKAGLPTNAWKDPEAKLFVFSAQVFNEEEYPELKRK